MWDTVKKIAEALIKLAEIAKIFADKKKEAKPKVTPKISNDNEYRPD